MEDQLRAEAGMRAAMDAELASTDARVRALSLALNRLTSSQELITTQLEKMTGMLGQIVDG